MNRHTERFSVRAYEMGQDNRARLQTICNYMEESAGHHATLLGVGLEALKEQNMTWVLAKMRLVLHHMPQSGEEVVVNTWPTGVERLLFRRDFQLHTGTGMPVASAITSWVLMNLETRKLERMPSFAAELIPPNPEFAIEEGDIRIPNVEQGTPGPVFAVRMADIDQNNHVNNVRYSEFALEAALQYQQTLGNAVRTLAGLDVIFRAEGVYGDRITSASMVEEGREDCLVHSLCRQHSGQELVKVRTVWK